MESRLGQTFSPGSKYFVVFWSPFSITKVQGKWLAPVDHSPRRKTGQRPPT